MIKHFVINLLIAVIVFSFASAYAAETRLKDGAYKGKHSFVEVLVTIENGRISEIEMVEHGGGGKEYADMVEPLIDEIILEQSTEVDAGNVPPLLFYFTLCSNLVHGFLDSFGVSKIIVL